MESDEIVVRFTRAQAQALLNTQNETRALVNAFKPEVRQKYTENPWWEACELLENGLTGSA